MTYIGVCEFCDEEIYSQDARAYAYGVRGWALKRSQGGTNHVIGQERIPDVVAHEMCAVEEYNKRRRGIAPGQGSIL